MTSVIIKKVGENPQDQSAFADILITQCAKDLTEYLYIRPSSTNPPEWTPAYLRNPRIDEWDLHDFRLGDGGKVAVFPDDQMTHIPQTARHCSAGPGLENIGVVKLAQEPIPGLLIYRVYLGGKARAQFTHFQHSHRFMCRLFGFDRTDHLAVFKIFFRLCPMY